MALLGVWCGGLAKILIIIGNNWYLFLGGSLLLCAFNVLGYAFFVLAGAFNVTN